jgi:hypothetical protein
MTVVEAPVTDYFCSACGGWLLKTRPTGEWLRTRCFNRKHNRPCPKYGQQQTIRLDPIAGHTPVLQPTTQ